jgi:hypothetical protein
MINIKLSISIFAGLEALLAVICLYGGRVWFLNAQVGFLSSFLIVICSFLGYKKMVNYRASIYENEADIIDKIEDPYGIWDDEESDKKPKIPYVKNTKTTLKGFFSPYRIASYVLFLIIFLILVKNGVFALIPFIIGVSCAPLSVLIYEALRTFLFANVSSRF